MQAQKTENPTNPGIHFGASISYGINLVTRTGDSAIVGHRNDCEKTLEMFQTGLDLRLPLNNHWYLQSGINYIQWVDESKFRTTDTVVLTGSKFLLSQIEHADGTVENYYGFVDAVIERTQTARFYNRYRFVEMPFLAGFRRPFGGMWYIECSAGPAVAMNIARSGNVIDENGMILPLQKSPYRNFGLLSVLARVEWMYCAGHWSAGIGFYGRIGLNNWAKNGAAFKEKRNSAGLTLVVQRALR